MDPEHDDEQTSDEDQNPVGEEGDVDEGPVSFNYLSRIDSDQLVTLRETGSMEAGLVKAKLESEGISCVIAGQTLNAIHPWLFPLVRLQVRERDFVRAELILSRPAAEEDDGEYADEDYRCPKCHRRDVELLPLVGAWRTAKIVFIWMFIVPLVYVVLHTALPAGTVPVISSGWIGLGWFALMAISSIAMLVHERRIRCKSCGEVWTKSTKG